MSIYQPPSENHASSTTERPVNGAAVASLVLSILWLCGLGSIVAVILGHVSLRQIPRRRQRGQGLAIAGLVIGYIGGGTIVVWLTMILAAAGGSQ